MSGALDELFELVDVNRDGRLDFAEVAGLFRQLSPEQGERSACNAAVEALLMADRNADSNLTRGEFEAMLSKIADVSGLPLHAAAQQLLAITRERRAAGVPHTVSAAAPECQQLQQAAAGEAPPPPQQQQQHSQQQLAPSSQQQQQQQQLSDKLLQLFKLWDRAGDGSVCFEEICQGLAKFQPVTGKQDVAAILTEAASVLATHDANNDRRLDFGEFTEFVGRYMRAAGLALEDVLDELVTIASTKPDSRKLQKLLDAAAPQINSLLGGGQPT